MAVQHRPNTTEAVVERKLDWRRALPELSNQTVTLRALKASDAASMLKHLCSTDVLKYIDAPTPSLEGFKQFIAWTHEELTRGTQICFGIVPAGDTKVVGIVQIRPRTPNNFETAEWGFVLGESHWGTGLFMASARLMLEFSFETLGVLRLEARAAAENVRGNAVLRKLGATQEGTLRSGSRLAVGTMDDVMWSILEEDWATMKELPVKPAARPRQGHSTMIH